MALIVDEEGTNLLLLRADKSIVNGCLRLRVRSLYSLHIDHLHVLIEGRDIDGLTSQAVPWRVRDVVRGLDELEVGNDSSGSITVEVKSQL